MKRLCQGIDTVVHMAGDPDPGATWHSLSSAWTSRTRALVGYAPQDDLTAENPALKELRLADVVNSHSLSDDAQESGLREEGQLKANKTGRVMRRGP